MRIQISESGHYLQMTPDQSEILGGWLGNEYEPVLPVS